MVAISLGILLLGKSITRGTLLGMALILCGILIVNRRRWRRAGTWASNGVHADSQLINFGTVDGEKN